MLEDVFRHARNMRERIETCIRQQMRDVLRGLPWRKIPDMVVPPTNPNWLGVNLPPLQIKIKWLVVNPPPSPK